MSSKLFMFVQLELKHLVGYISHNNILKLYEQYKILD